MHNIISGIIIGAAVIVGIWCVWYENHSSSDQTKDDEENK